MQSRSQSHPWPAVLCVLLLAVTARGSEVVSLELTDVPPPVPSAFAQFGGSVDLGDANGDGVLDMVVSSANYNSAQGQVWVLWGPDFATGVAATPPAVQQGDALGVYGVSFHDLNQDGLQDVVTWDRFKQSGFKGRVWILWAPLFDTSVSMPPDMSMPFFEYGSTWDAGDVTGDGVPDLVVGNANAYAGGSLFVYDLATGFGMPPAFVLKPPVLPIIKWGYTVLVDDLDLDGVNEILTTQTISPDPPPYSRVMYLNSLNPADQVEVYENINPTGGINPCYCRSRFVDVNADGFRDLVHAGQIPAKTGGGAPPHEDTTVMVRFGPAFTSSKMLCQPAPQKGSLFGTALDVGDVNRDGVNDVVAGAPYYHFPEFDWYGLSSKDGRFTIFFGPDFQTTQVYDALGPNVAVGFSVGVADIDRDGFAEVFVGAYNASRVYRFQHHSLRPLEDPELSVSTGGSVPLSLECGKLSADENYLVLVGASGSTPGVDLPSLSGTVHLPLNIDAVTTIGLQLVNTSVLAGFQGQLDAAGEGLAVLNLPPALLPPSAVGLTLTFAGVTFAPTGKVRYATHPVGVLFVP